MCSFGSHADLHRLGESPIPSWVQIGEPVIVLFTRGGSKTGIVQYTGTTEFAAGNWVGVELDTPDGKFHAWLIMSPDLCGAMIYRTHSFPWQNLTNPTANLENSAAHHSNTSEIPQID